ncbi:MAG TPA: twin-arginine translocase TatA/TatE family subunit [Phycisphaerales bacterium]|nr:twin-arginine translocase TatA/TatE family subunit [Phycisphaerales bacterium]
MTFLGKTILFHPGIWTPGPWEIVLILVVVLLLFGGKKLPELARGLARGLRTFRNELKGVRDNLDREEETPAPHETDKHPEEPGRKSTPASGARGDSSEDQKQEAGKD